jgi:hypothetical protein
MSDTEVTTQATLGGLLFKKKKKQKYDLGNPTINKVKELIDSLSKRKSAMLQL